MPERSHSGNRGRGSSWLRLLAPLFLSVGLLVALRLLGPQYLNQQRLSEWLRPLGVLAPVAFILLLAVRPLTLLPGQLFTAVGGILFGMAFGTLYALIGSLLATGVIHLVARRLVRRPVKWLAGDKHPAIKRAARKHGFLMGFLACINSMIPADVILATASASGARFWPLALGALVGTAPGTVLTAVFGSSLAQGKTWMTAASAIGMALSLVLGLVLGRRLLREVHAAEAELPGRQASHGGARGTAPPVSPRRMLASTSSTLHGEAPAGE